MKTETNPSSPLNSLNDMKIPEYARALGGILENSPHLAARTWYARPFRTAEDLHRAFVNVVRTLSESEQVTLIKAHPGFLSKNCNFPDDPPKSSETEIGPPLTEAQREQLAGLVLRYNRRFGFPFIIRERGRTAEDIKAAFETRIPMERPVEMIAALDEICEIARERIEDMFRA